MFVVLRVVFHGMPISGFCKKRWHQIYGSSSFDYDFNKLNDMLLTETDPTMKQHIKNQIAQYQNVEAEKEEEVVAKQEKQEKIKKASEVLAQTILDPSSAKATDLNNAIKDNKDDPDIYKIYAEAYKVKKKYTKSNKLMAFVKAETLLDNTVIELVIFSSAYSRYVNLFDIHYNQYVREKIDEYTGKTEKRFGFKTTSLTRPTIISRLIQIVREEVETINDKDTLEELLTIIRNEKGRIEAPEGGHDDQMMGLAIAHHIREQVVFDIEPIVVNPQKHFNLEKANEMQYDYGEEITII